MANFELDFSDIDNSTDDPDFDAGKDESADSSEEEILVVHKRSRAKQDNIKETAEDFLKDRTPINTQKSMKTAVNAFHAFHKEISPERDVNMLQLSKKDLSEDLERFFMGILREDGSPYNPATLGTYHNGIAKYLIEERSIDIKRDPEFVRLEKIIARRQEESVKEGKLAGMNAAKPVPKEVLTGTFAQGKIGCNSPKSLTAYVIACFEMGFGIRSRQEMYDIKNMDIKRSSNLIDGIPEFIELDERMTKVRRGNRKQGTRVAVPRIYSDRDPKKRMVRPFLKMQSKKNDSMLLPDQPIFLTCKQLKESNPDDADVWFTSQRLIYFCFYDFVFSYKNTFLSI